MADVDRFHYNNEIKHHIQIVAPAEENAGTACNPSTAKQNGQVLNEDKIQDLAFK